jgi:hypothetical protein
MEEPVRDSETDAVRNGEMTFAERMERVKRRSHGKAQEAVAHEMMRVSAENDPVVGLRKRIGNFLRRIIPRQ